MPDQLFVIDAFRALHQSGCFVLPNPWDAGSAVYLQHLGFKALATSSAGFAFTKGLPDSVSAVPLEMMLAHFREVVEATPLPVNADFQNGYADDPDGVARNVARGLATGVAGLSIEDATGERAQPLYEFELAVDRVRAARAAMDAARIPALLTARCEAYLVGQPDLSFVIDRLKAFADVGADCVYAPGVSKPDEIATIVKMVTPLPVNVLVSSPNPDLSLARLTDLGVRRISVGSGLARVAWGAFIKAARTIAESGSFEGFAGAASFAELNDLFV
jgi:2-methylisocitrate lyase-like PEP mutase family enzyme